MRAARGAVRKTKKNLFLHYYFAPAKKSIVFVRIACYLLTELHKLQQ